MPLIGQIDIEEENLTLKTPSNLIENGRYYLTLALKENNYSKLEEIVTYLDNVEKKRIISVFTQ